MLTTTLSRTQVNYNSSLHNPHLPFLPFPLPTRAILLDPLPCDLPLLISLEALPMPSKYLLNTLIELLPRDPQSGRARLPGGGGQPKLRPSGTRGRLRRGRARAGRRRGYCRLRVYCRHQLLELRIDRTA